MIKNLFERFNKFNKRTMFDAAAEPVAIALLGWPILLIILVFVLITVTINLIKKARKKYDLEDKSDDSNIENDKE